MEQCALVVCDDELIWVFIAFVIVRQQWWGSFN